MEAKTTKKIKDMLCQKMEEIARANSLSNTDVEKLNMLIVAYEKLLKAEEMEGLGEYSQGRYSRDGYWTAQGGYSKGNDMMYDERGNSYRYDDGMSEARRGTHYVRGHYSRNDASEMTKQRIRNMMSSGNMSIEDKRTLEEAMELM